MDAANTSATAEQAKANAPIGITWASTESHEPLGKIWAPEGEEWEVAPGVKRLSYVFEEPRYPDFAAFAEDLDARLRAGCFAMVAGRLKRAPQTLDLGKAYRRVGKNFADLACRLLTLDFDGMASTEAGERLDRPEDFGERIFREVLKLLPAAFNADCLLVATSSTGLPFNAKGEPANGCARFRAIFLLSRPLFFAEQKQLTLALQQLPGLACLGEEICNVPQFCFIARPEFPDDMDDPIATPVLLFKGDQRHVDVDALEMQIQVTLTPKARTGPVNVEDRLLDVDGVALRHELIERLVGTIPNDTKEHGGDWIAVLHGIKGASGDPHWGKHLWLEFCERWTKGESDDEEDERVWDSARFDHGTAGIGKLLRLAWKAGTTESIAAVEAVKLAQAHWAFRDPPDDLPDGGEREMRRIDLRAPYDTARLFQRGLAVPLRHHRGGFFEWSGCAWLEADEDGLRARLYAFLDQCWSITSKGGLQAVKPNAQMVGAVLDALRAAAQLGASIEPPAWLDGAYRQPPHTLVACANGLMHLPTRMLLAHTPSYFNHNALDFAYDPNAPKPQQWLNFLNQLWDDDLQAVDTLQEIFGYALTPDTSQQKAFALIGPKRSGKGTIARILVAILGVRNCAAPTLAGLGTNFGLAPLIGKRVAVISDARLSRRVDQHVIAERLLSVTGEDAITIDRKYKSAWTGQLRARFLILSNELFRLADASGALASRFILLMLTKSFYGQEDSKLTAKLMTELPGILNWAIAGWARLERRGYFQQPESAKEAVEQLEDLASPIGAFVRECCDIGAAHSIPGDSVFLAWKIWCLEQGRDHPGTKQSFGRDLKAAQPGLKVTQPREEGRQQRRHYQGIRLKPVAAVADDEDDDPV